MQQGLKLHKLKRQNQKTPQGKCTFFMFLVLFVFAQRLLETLQKHASDHAKK